MAWALTLHYSSELCSALGDFDSGKAFCSPLAAFINLTCKIFGTVKKANLQLHKNPDVPMVASEIATVMWIPRTTNVQQQW